MKKPSHERLRLSAKKTSRLSDFMDKDVVDKEQGLEI